MVRPIQHKSCGGCLIRTPRTRQGRRLPETHRREHFDLVEMNSGGRQKAPLQSVSYPSRRFPWSFHFDPVVGRHIYGRCLSGPPRVRPFFVRPCAVHVSPSDLAHALSVGLRRHLVAWRRTGGKEILGRQASPRAAGAHQTDRRGLSAARPQID